MHFITTIIALLIVLGVVVFIHELGHFLAARWAGVRVDTFSIGFGPAIVKWHDKHGTVWKIACLPLGGYVSIYGQEDMFDRKKYAELAPSKKIGHYLSAPAWKRQRMRRCWRGRWSGIMCARCIGIIIGAMRISCLPIAWRWILIMITARIHMPGCIRRMC